MIQRMIVIVNDRSKLPGVVEGLKELGFSDGGIRCAESEAGIVNVYAYRDQDFDAGQLLRLDRMEDHCVRIWSRVGYLPVTLETFAPNGERVDFTKVEHDKWLED